MEPDFEQLLAATLAPPNREPDVEFVLRVRLLCALDGRLRAERQARLGLFGRQALALAAFAAGLIWIGRAAPIEGFTGSSPALALIALLSVFAMLVAALAASSPGEPRTRYQGAD